MFRQFWIEKRWCEYLLKYCHCEQTKENMNNSKSLKKGNKKDNLLFKACTQYENTGLNVSR